MNIRARYSLYILIVLAGGLLFLTPSPTPAADLPAGASAKVGLPLDEIIANIQANQSKIEDMYAETTTTITSNIAMPGAESKGSQKMVQKGKMWTKGSDKSKIEMLSPMKQITITNGDQMAIINPETGQKIIQDLKKLKGQVPGGKGQGEMNLGKAREFFDLSAVKKGEDYVIVGVPKKENKFLGKMEFYVDAERWVPVKILMFSSAGMLMSQSEIDYEKCQVSNGKGQEKVWAPVRNVSNISTPIGKLGVEMIYQNIKINKGISDNEFIVE